MQNGLIYLAGCDERFRAVRVADGKTLFEMPLGAYVGASTVVAGDRAYVGTCNAEVLAIDLRRMLEHAGGYHSDIVEGRFVVEARHAGQPWEVIVEPDDTSQLIVVITAYPVEQEEQ